ncbi:hypothetical protein [Psychrobacter sp. JCM 18900]|uniref:hypothetical protein n=1 Tax=Psychrobacter sp. JCM 18900 TaxID=1298608 RepID=UPI0004358108|nr:hypothetical protein [Psychrobacter sp. JCM 18900]GAF53192.1 hypothetical protein JCM18900_11752 [Psychrobacter sp. JCM 18900]
MKLAKAVLASICILPLATIAYAEDVNTQNLRISETSMMSVNEAAPATMKMHNDNDHMGEKSNAIQDGSDVEVDKERTWRWLGRRRTKK